MFEKNKWNVCLIKTYCLYPPPHTPLPNGSSSYIFQHVSQIMTDVSYSEQIISSQQTWLLMGTGWISVTALFVFASAIAGEQPSLFVWGLGNGCQFADAKALRALLWSDRKGSAEHCPCCTLPNDPSQSINPHRLAASESNVESDACLRQEGELDMWALLTSISSASAMTRYDQPVTASPKH